MAAVPDEVGAGGEATVTRSRFVISEKALKAPAVAPVKGKAHKRQGTGAKTSNCQQLLGHHLRHRTRAVTSCRSSNFSLHTTLHSVTAEVSLESATWMPRHVQRAVGAWPVKRPVWWTCSIADWHRDVLNVGHVSWSVDGRYLLSRSDSQPHVLWVWDIVRVKLAAALVLCR